MLRPVTAFTTLLPMSPAFSSNPPKCPCNLTKPRVVRRVSPRITSSANKSPDLSASTDNRIQTEDGTTAAEPFQAATSSLRQGILSIAVGKLGEKPIPPAIIPAITVELNAAEESSFPPFDLLLLRASFLGALFMKQSLNAAEHRILRHATRLSRTASAAKGRSRAPDDDSNHVAPGEEVTAGEVLATIVVSDDHLNSPLAKFAFRLLCGEFLSQEEACTLGLLLYADEAMFPMKALIAHVMRVRHESAEELAGLAQAVMAETKQLGRPKDRIGRSNRPFALISEPFDGVVTWDLLTPLVARHLSREHGLDPIVSVGESSGPKYGPNVQGLMRELQMEGFDFGTMAEQAQVHGGLAKWVDMRRVIVKRPALATVEKYADASAGGARLFVASAFHPGYVEKMATAAEGVGFPSYIVIGKGMEGCIGLGVGNRVANVLVGWRVSKDGATSHEYGRMWLKYACEKRPSKDVAMPVKGNCEVGQNARRIERYVKDGSSGDVVFDLRVFATMELLDQAVEVIKTHAPGVFQECGEDSGVHVVSQQ